MNRESVVVRSLRDDSGFALAAVMGAIALITAIAVAGYFVAENALNESKRVSTENRAYQAAASSLERELAVFDAQSFLAGLPSKSGYTYGQPEAVGGDSFIVTVRTLGPDEYEMLSTGRAGDTTETVRVRFQSINLWDMNISGDENVGSGAGFNGNGIIIGKVYCKGDFEWTGSAGIEGGPVFVRDGQFIKQSAGSYVGTDEDPVGGYFDEEPDVADNDDRWNVEEKGSAPKLTIPWPTEADMANWRQTAEKRAEKNILGTNGSDFLKHANAGGVYTVWDGNSTIGGSGAPEFYGKPGGPAFLPDGSIDELTSGDVIAVAPSLNGNGKTMFINGVVYCTGVLTIASDIKYYSGKGVLVAEDGFVIDGRLVPYRYDFAPVAPPNAEMYTTADGKTEKLPMVSDGECLGLVSLGNVILSGGQWVCGAVFTAGRFSASGTAARFRGSIIANGIDYSLPNGWLVTQPGLASKLPNEMPPLNNINAQGDWIRQ